MGIEVEWACHRKEKSLSSSLIGIITTYRKEDAMPNPLLPDELMAALSVLRPVFHAASWESFLYLLMGLLVGHAQAGLVRASRWGPWVSAHIHHLSRERLI